MRIAADINSEDEIETWVKAMIADHGYAQISMHGPDPNEPGYAFTVGLTETRGSGEFFCMGVAPDIAAQLFSICIGALDDGRLGPGLSDRDVAGLVEDFTLRFRRLDPALVAQTAHAAIARYGHGVALHQIILPDEAGLFPGDDGCNPAYIAAQDPDRLLRGALN